MGGRGRPLDARRGLRSGVSPRHQTTLTPEPPPLLIPGTVPRKAKGAGHRPFNPGWQLQSPGPRNPRAALTRDTARPTAKSESLSAISRPFSAKAIRITGTLKQNDDAEGLRSHRPFPGRPWPGHTTRALRRTDDHRPNPPSRRGHPAPLTPFHYRRRHLRKPLRRHLPEAPSAPSAVIST